MKENISLHRYFSSIFPRQSKANAIFIANKRIEPLRFLKKYLISKYKNKFFFLLSYTS